MSQLTSADSAKLAELQSLCDDCKDAIESQSDRELKNAMQQACDRCKSVRHLMPDLMELRLKTEAFVGSLQSA